uniref:Uncharacterized protein n=1 Tax=Triticum urartu TaxID=4572 RepID=A0A8R7TWZ0_TRIUA
MRDIYSTSTGSRTENYVHAFIFRPVAITQCYLDRNYETKCTVSHTHTTRKRCNNPLVPTRTSGAPRNGVARSRKRRVALHLVRHDVDGEALVVADPVVGLAGARLGRHLHVGPGGPELLRG